MCSYAELREHFLCSPCLWEFAVRLWLVIIIIFINLAKAKHDC